MPALVNRRLGASGRSDDDGTMVCCFSRKKSRKLCRISVPVMMPELNATLSKTRVLPQFWGKINRAPSLLRGHSLPLCIEKFRLLSAGAGLNEVLLYLISSGAEFLYCLPHASRE